MSKNTKGLSEAGAETIDGYVFTCSKCGHWIESPSGRNFWIKADVIERYTNNLHKGLACSQCDTISIIPVKTWKQAQARVMVLNREASIKAWQLEVEAREQIAEQTRLKEAADRKAYLESTFGIGDYVIVRHGNPLETIVAVINGFTVPHPPTSRRVASANLCVFARRRSEGGVVTLTDAVYINRAPEMLVAVWDAIISLEWDVQLLQRAQDNANQLTGYELNHIAYLKNNAMYLPVIQKRLRNAQARLRQELADAQETQNGI